MPIVAPHIAGDRSVREVSPGLDTDNDAANLPVARSARPVVCGRGVHGASRGRSVEVLGISAGAGMTMVCLGRTADGEPRHLLCLPCGLSPRLRHGDCATVPMGIVVPKAARATRPGGRRTRGGRAEQRGEMNR